MMAGKPIIYAIDTPESLIEKYGCGIAAKSGKISEIKSAMEQLYNMTEDERSEMGKKGKEAVLRYYNYTILAGRLEKLFIK